MGDRTKALSKQCDSGGGLEPGASLRFIYRRSGRMRRKRWTWGYVGDIRKPWMRLPRISTIAKGVVARSAGLVTLVGGVVYLLPSTRHTTVLAT